MISSRAPCGGALGELGVGGEDRDGLRLRLLRRGEIEEADREGVDALRPDRDHREVFVVVEFVVDADRGEADRQLLVLDDGRHRRRDEIGAVGPEQQVDFVDGDQLGVDARHVRRRALVVVDDELDRPAEQPALGVDVVAPDFERGVDHLARRSAGAGERQAHADLDRIAALRGRARQRRAARRSTPRRTCAAHSTHLSPSFPPVWQRRRCAPPYRCMRAICAFRRSA